ncbi:FecR family protein [Colwellia piezophila]|uniref:FecR family protein n=1 Tax=Colwellia piezophila TaxID=211668 RepID=UPI00037D7D70|nr:FecR domain-containing protein [Colwellia piezophila]
MSNVKGFTNTQKIKEEAANWLLKIDDKARLSTDETNELRAWIATSDIHRAVMIRMSKTWENMDVLAALRVAPERSSLFSLDKLKTMLGINMLTSLFKNNEKPSGSSLFFKLTTVSACLLVGLIFINSMINNPMESDSQYYATNIGEYKKQILADGSTLWLNSNSKVRVDYSENFRRIALITGEAHFEVQKDATRPFEVYAMNRLVRALGTAFSVHKLKGRVEVLVSEGTVELAIVDDVLLLKPNDLLPSTNIQLKQKEQTITRFNEPVKVSKYLGKLSAGQSMSISAISTAEDNHIVHLDKSELGRKLSWLNGQLVFAGETLEEVVTEISRHTEIKIDIPDPELRKLRIGGHFDTGETDKLFYLLDSGFGIVVNKIDENHVELLKEETSSN